MKKANFDRLLPPAPSECQISDFKDLKAIGCTAYAENLQARAKKDHKNYIIKKYSKKKILKAKLLPYVLAEIDSLQRLGDNEYTMKMFGHFEDSETMYILLEHISNGTLSQKLQRDKRFQESEAISCAKSVIEIIEFLHHNNILHRDIKPENLLVKKSDKKQTLLKLSEFGWSTVQDHNLNFFIGTLEYTAPEIILQKTHTLAIDVWCLGVIIYEMLVGKTPFEPTPSQLKTLKKDAVQKNILSGKCVFPAFLSQGAKDLLSQLLQVNPELRPSIVEIKTHWWINGKPKPKFFITKELMLQQLAEKGKVQELTIPFQQQTQATLIDNAKQKGLEEEMKIERARSSIKIKLQKQKHQRNFSQVALVLKNEAQKEIQKFSELNQRLEEEEQQMRAEVENLLGQLKLQSSQSTRFECDRVSVVSFSNYSNKYRQDRCRMQLQKMQLLKGEKFCLNQQLQELEQSKENLLEAEAKISALNEGLLQGERYHQELQTTWDTLEKQVNQLVERQNFMNVQIELLQLKQHTEDFWMKKSTEVYFTEEMLKELMRELGLFENALEADQKNRSQRKSTIQDRQVQQQIENYAEDFIIRKQHLQMQYKEDLGKLRQRKATLEQECSENEELLNMQDMDQMNAKLRDTKGMCADLQDKLEKMNQQDFELHLTIKDQEQKIKRLEDELKARGEFL